MSSNLLLPCQQDTIINHSKHLLYSFHHWLGHSLLDMTGSPAEVAQMLFNAPFVLVSHGIETDPILNYGNRKALELWELTWEDLTHMPSRKTAEAMVQEKRNQMLAETTAKGFCNFSGVRITSTGKRFRIADGILWNVIDTDNNLCGQAAIFSQWEFI